MKIEMNIARVEATVKRVRTGNPELLAFGTLKFFTNDSSEFKFKIAGFRIVKRGYGEKQFIKAEYPAYPIGKDKEGKDSYMKSFYINSIDRYREISSLFSRAYNQEVGDTEPLEDVEVHPDDIPF